MGKQCGVGGFGEWLPGYGEIDVAPDFGRIAIQHITDNFNGIIQLRRKWCE